MSEITVTSTTDTPEAVAQALGVEADEVVTELETPPPETPAKTDGDGSESGSASGADTQDTQDTDTDDASDTDSDDSDDADDTTDEGTKPPPVQAKKKGGWQKKIDKLTRAVYDRDRELADLRARVAQPPAVKVEDKPVVAQKVELPAAPDLEDTNTDGTPKYATYGDFLGALGSWTKTVTETARTEAEKSAAASVEAKFNEMQKNFEINQTQQRQLEQANQAWQTRRSAAKSLYTDWDAVVDQNDELQITPTMTTLMHAHPKGADLAYWYGKNPSEVARIAALHPEEQKLELGYIIKTLKPPVKSSTSTTIIDNSGNGGGRKKSAAPKPLRDKAVRANATTVKDYRYWETAPLSEYMKARDSGLLK